jgi:autotransporter-associated beta strand protein
MTWIVGGLGTDETFNGIINNEAVGGQQGTTSLVKEGDGYWRLNGNNIYKGTTLIERGNMIFNGTNTGTGAITVKEEATLSGKGSVAGSVTVMESGTIAPGDLGIGMFTVKSSVSLREESALEIEIDRSNKTNDKLSVTGALSIAGNLKIDLIDGSFEAGDEVSVLSAGSYNGAFAQIIPEVPGVGLKWDTSSLYTSGMLKVQTGETATDFFGADCLTIIPSRGNIRIEGFQQPTVIEMYNLSGVRMARENVNSSSCLIDINPGFYVLKIGTDAVKVAVP